MNVRLSMFFGSIVAGILVVALLTAIIPRAPQNPGGHDANPNSSFAGDLLLDRNSNSFPYPFTIQNLMWLVFCIGIGELALRYVMGGNETRQLERRLLPEDEQTVL
ncbi:MAG: hypothetical protein OD918_10800, partial [Gammaproteobacteria bacterium]